MFLESDKIYLRDVDLTDVNDTYCKWMNDPEINQYMETRFYLQNKASIMEIVKKHKDKSDEPFFAICLKKNNKHVGNIKLGPINYCHQTADISYFIGERSCWGLGIASEAIKLVVQFGFFTLALKKISAGTYYSNSGSQAVLKKNGFSLEGRLRSHVSLMEGQREDCLIWGLLADEYCNHRK